MDIFETLQKQVGEKITLYKFDTNNFVFEDRVALKCFYCSKYDTKWTCPPRIPNVDYKSILSEYKNAVIAVYKVDYTGEVTEDIRFKSTNEIHKALLGMEKTLWKEDKPMHLSFIGGSCKLCKNGCDKVKCNNPGLKRIPIEAIGINVIKSLKSIDINISFKPIGYFYRVGLLVF